MSEATSPEVKDWAGRRRAFLVAWGLPIAALAAAAFLAPPAKTLVWIAALTWMGVACLANALRCGRTHCYLTGPFFLVMAVAAALHGFEVVALGADGWRWLGITTGLGAVALWYLPERLWGRYARRRGTSAPRGQD